MTAKGVFKSKTIWGGMIAALPAVGLVLETLEILPEGGFNELQAATISFAGAIISIYGRMVVKESPIVGLLRGKLKD